MCSPVLAVAETGIPIDSRGDETRVQTVISKATALERSEVVQLLRRHSSSCINLNLKIEAREKLEPETRPGRIESPESSSQSVQYVLKAVFENI